MTGKKILTSDCKKYDLKFRFYIRDGLGRDIYYKLGVYQEDYISSFLLKETGINSDDLVIDIGANIGWYSLVLSSKNRPTVLAFEPDKLNYSLLKENTELNARTNIRPFNLALGNEKGKMTLFLYKKYNLGRHSFIKQKNSMSSEEVEVTVLDKFLDELGLGRKKIKLIKIDIEGFEYIAMQGATSALRRTEYLITEFTPNLMKEINQEPMDYINLVRNLGFNISVISPSGLSIPDFEDLISKGQQVNLFCTNQRIHQSENGQ
jgi:FkbM family methyltransferase